MVLISMAVGLVAKKFFGSRHRDADEDVQGDHPVVRAIFGAMNTGDFDGVSEPLAAARAVLFDTEL